MSSVKLGSALPYAPRCFTTEQQGLYMVSEAHYEVHVSLSHARDKTKNLFPYFFNELKSLIWTAKSIDLMVECSTIKPYCAPLYKNRQSTLKF